MNRNKLTAALLAALAIILGTLLLDSVLPVLGLAPALAITLPDVAQNFITVFLGIFIEAAPFLLLGSIASGLIDVFVTADDIARLFPRNKVGATLVGTFLGILFPVCECGVVPVVRRLYQKGLPISSGIAFLLAAPVINPVVIASTYAAFGLSTIFWARIGFTLLVAFGTGLVFSVQPSFVRVMLPRSLAPVMGGANDEGRATSEPTFVPRPSSLVSVTKPPRLQRAFGIAADDFFDMGRYLVIGGLIATALQTFVPQSALVSIGRNPVSSVLALQLLAFVLSVCSTVDAFLALSFLNTFSAGAIIAFLVFGPMIDIKSLLMFSGVFRKRIVFYLLLLPFLMALVIGVFVNLNLNW
jgi:uncharacterized protein